MKPKIQNCDNLVELQARAVGAVHRRDAVAAMELRKKLLSIPLAKWRTELKKYVEITK